jgi:hypothetical protein
VLTTGFRRTHASAICHRHAQVGHLPAEPVDHRDVPGEVLRREDRLAEGDALRAPVGLGEARLRGERAGEEAVAERPVAHDADAVARAVREHLALHAPVEEMVPDCAASMRRTRVQAPSPTVKFDADQPNLPARDLVHGRDASAMGVSVFGQWMR